MFRTLYQLFFRIQNLQNVILYLVQCNRLIHSNEVSDTVLYSSTVPVDLVTAFKLRSREPKNLKCVKVESQFESSSLRM